MKCALRTHCLSACFPPMDTSGVCNDHIYIFNDCLFHLFDIASNVAHAQAYDLSGGTRYFVTGLVVVLQKKKRSSTRACAASFAIPGQLSSTSIIWHVANIIPHACSNQAQAVMRLGLLEDVKIIERLLAWAHTTLFAIRGPNATARGACFTCPLNCVH